VKNTVIRAGLFHRISIDPELTVFILPGMFPAAMAPEPHFGMFADGFFEKAYIPAGKFPFRQLLGIFSSQFKIGPVVATLRFIDL
jgi:hypothetical protein